MTTGREPRRCCVRASRTCFARKRKGATSGRRRLFLLRHRRRGAALLGPVRRLVDLAGAATEAEDASAVSGGDELSLLARADARENARLERELLLGDLQRRSPS